MNYFNCIIFMVFELKILQSRFSKNIFTIYICRSGKTYQNLIAKNLNVKLLKCNHDIVRKIILLFDIALSPLLIYVH